MGRSCPGGSIGRSGGAHAGHAGHRQVRWGTGRSGKGITRSCEGHRQVRRGLGRSAGA